MNGVSVRLGLESRKQQFAYEVNEFGFQISGNCGSVAGLKRSLNLTRADDLDDQVIHQRNSIKYAEKQLVKVKASLERRSNKLPEERAQVQDELEEVMNRLNTESSMSM